MTKRIVTKRACISEHTGEELTKDEFKRSAGAFKIGGFPHRETYCPINLCLSTSTRSARLGSL